MNARAGLVAIASALVVATTSAACTRPRPAPVASAPAVAPSSSSSSATCASCHAAIADEWRASFHRTAFTDSTFQRSLSLEEPKEHGFCLRCHAPTERTAGVDCSSCHAAPHTSNRAAGASTCATCHEFAFDDGRADLVQKTVSEHASSPWADVSCSECHMPVRDGHKDHRFVAGHAPTEMIANAVHVSLARASSTSMHFTVRVDAGHAFPTGDMFRRARLQVFAEDAKGAIVGDAERIFGRTWGSETTGPHAGHRKETSDTRIRGTWNETLSFDTKPGTITRVRWSLVYERVIAMRGPHVELASSDVIAEGDAAW